MRKIALSFILIFLSSCNQHYPLSLGSNYFLDHDGNSDTCIIDSENTLIVAPDILKMDYDSINIIAEIKPMFVILERNKNSDYNKLNNDIENSLLREYWIIDKEKSINYGPFTKFEFLEKRKKLRVSEKLQLKPVS